MMKILLIFLIVIFEVD